MYIVANTQKLTEDGIINTSQASEMKLRARETMVNLAINLVLCFGILSATGGLIFWLASPISVAICGILFLGSGLFILAKGKELFQMFGNAAALIGSGMMIGGAAIELLDKYSSIAGPALIIGGAIIAVISAYRFATKAFTTKFVTGSIMLMGAAVHLIGMYYLLDRNAVSGFPVSLSHLYSTAIIIALGWFTNIRTLTALAIIPFAQALNTGTAYFTAAYVFYSPESTLSILQMALLIIAALWVSAVFSERTARHSRIVSVIAFIVANLCALVGSIWGDRIGETIWGPGIRYYKSGFENQESWKTAREAFLENAWIVSADVYSILWAIALVAIIILAAHRNNRGLFNTAMTFAGIHAYTQIFESFADEPLAWVIGGLAAIPLAWGMWRLNKWFNNRTLTNTEMLDTPNKSTQ